MGNVTVFLHLTLDGVMQAPGRIDEDPRDGFAQGGWASPRGDAAGVAAGGAVAGGALLLGRWTFESFFSYWPHQTDNPFTAMLNDMPKYVASTTLVEPLPWSNSTLFKGDVAEAVASLKQQPAMSFLVMGSGDLLQTLMLHHLVDRYVLMIHPLVLGTGRRLFRDGGPPTTLRLVDTKTTDSGVVVATYETAPVSGRNTQ